MNVALSQTSIFQHVAQLKEYVDRLRTPFMQFAGELLARQDSLSVPLAAVRACSRCTLACLTRLEFAYFMCLMLPA